MDKKAKKLQGVKIFKRYLKENGIYALFFKEVEKSKKTKNCYWSNDCKGSILSLFEECDKTPDAIIARAFFWFDSIMGIDFWNYHYHKFRGYFLNNLNGKQ